MAEVFSSIPKLAMPAELLVAENIHHIAARFRKTQEEVAKIQWELNLRIADLRLKEQPPTPLEVRE